MNEVAKLNETNEIVVADPFSPTTYHAASDVQALIKSACSRLALRVQQRTSLGDLAEAPIEAVRELRKAIEEDDDALKDFDSSVKDALLALSGFKAYIVQTKGTGARIDALSVRGKLAAILKELKAREDAEKPQERPEKRMLVLDAVPSAWKKIEAAITKAGVKIGFMSGLSSAKRIEQVGKVIQAIEADEAAANAAMANV